MTPYKFPSTTPLIFFSKADAYDYALVFFDLLKYGKYAEQSMFECLFNWAAWEDIQ